MVRFLFHILFFLMGFTLTLGIMGGVLCSLQKHSSKLLQIIGSYSYLEQFAFWYYSLQ